MLLSTASRPEPVSPSDDGSVNDMTESHGSGGVADRARDNRGLDGRERIAIGIDACVGATACADATANFMLDPA